MPSSEELSRVWWDVVVPHKGDNRFGHVSRIAKKLARTYKRNGFKSVVRNSTINIMARVVRPVPQDLDDHIMLPPDPPPLSEAGLSPPPLMTRTSPPNPDPQTPTPFRK